MQMDQKSTLFPAEFSMQLDQDLYLLKIDLPSLDAIPFVPAGRGDDFDLMGEPVNDGKARAGALQHLQAGRQTIRLWPLPAVARPSVGVGPSHSATSP